MKLPKILKRKAKRDKFPIPTDYPVEYAFTVGDRKFFRFTDPNNMPAGRSLSAIKMYMQLQTSCDEQWLQHYSDAMREVLNNQQKIELIKLVELQKMLEDRLKWIFHPGMLLDYASVIYMGEDENPYTYDDEYNRQKIQFWKENATAHDFFLTMHIRQLIPFLETAEISALNYSKAVIDLDLSHHQKLLEALSLALPSSGSKQSLQSRIMSLEGLRLYANGLQQHTTFLSRKG